MISEDKAINQIDEFIDLYQGGVEKYGKKHKFTRTASIASFAVIAFILIVLALDKTLSLDIMSLIPYNVVDFGLTNFILIFLLPIMAILYLINSYRFFFELIVIFQITIFSIFMSIEVSVLLISINISIFLLSYFINRQQGYTRAWSRNRTMVFHLKRLRKEHEIAVQDMDDPNVKIEQENTLTKVFSLEEENVNAMHKDIVGDYFTAQDSSLNLLKSIRNNFK